MTTETLTVLHLTDLHLTNRLSHDKEQEIVIAALLADIEQLTLSGIKPDIVVFTGDLVNDADEKDVYLDALDRFIFPLMQKARLKGEAFFCAPGNHDAQRTVIQTHSAQHREFYSTYDRNSTNTFFRDGTYAELTSKKFSAFREAMQFADAPCIDLASGYSIIEIADADCTFCLWNTAFSTAGGLKAVNSEDYGKLLVPEYQVIEMCAKVKEKNRKSNYLVAHHPLNWVKEDIRNAISGLITETYDAIFAGHIHQNAPAQILTPDGTAIHFQTGALYQGRERWNGYTIVRVSPSANTYEVRARRFSPEARKFVPAVEMGQNGIFYPEGSSKVFWRARPSVDRLKWATWTMEELKPDFINRHSETLVGRSLDEVFYSHPMETKISDYETPTSLEDDVDITFETVLQSSENFVIFGETNFGKSTLLKRLGLALIDQSANPEKIGIPALLEFADISLSGDAMIKAIRQSLPQVGAHNELRMLLQEGTIAVLIDDVDPSDLSRMATLSSFVAEYPRCRYIFTSRSVDRLAIGLVASFNEAVPFTEVVLRPLKSRGIRGFTELYCGHTDHDECGRITNMVISILKKNELPATAFSVSVLIEVMNTLQGGVIIDQVSLIERFVEYLLAKSKITETRLGALDFNDQTDCLSHVAGQMAQTGEYNLSYEDLSLIISGYIDNLGLSYKATDLITKFIKQKILKKTDGGAYRFYLRAFLEYFIANRMRRNIEFRDWVMNEERYLSFVHEIEFYTGLYRNDVGILEMIAARHEEILLDVRSEWTVLDANGFDHVTLPSNVKAVDDLREHLAAPPLTREEKDEMVDAELMTCEGPQDAFRPTIDNIGTKYYLSLTLYSSVVRNLVHISKEAKERHIDLLMTSWIQHLGHSFSIIPSVVKHRKLKFNGVEYRAFTRATISDEKLTRLMMLYMPTAISALIRNYMGNDKLIKQIEFDPAGNRSGIEKLIRTFLLSDLDVGDWLAVANQLRESFRDKPYLAGALIWKLNAIFKMRDLHKDKAERLASIVARLCADQYSQAPDERKKIYESRFADMRRMISLKTIKSATYDRKEARITISSELRGATDALD